MGIVRRISVGPNYKDAMHFEVGQKVVRGRYIISSIIINDDYSACIYVVEPKEKLEFGWKEVPPHMPYLVENNLDFA